MSLNTELFIQAESLHLWLRNDVCRLSASALNVWWAPWTGPVDTRGILIIRLTIPERQIILLMIIIEFYILLLFALCWNIRHVTIQGQQSSLGLYGPKLKTLPILSIKNVCLCAHPQSIIRMTSLWGLPKAKSLTPLLHVFLRHFVNQFPTMACFYQLVCY